MDESVTPPRFELTAEWLDYIDRGTRLPIHMTVPSEESRTAIAPPFRGSYAQCAVRANEILARLPPMALRWVPSFGVLPLLCIRIDSVTDG